MTSKKNGKYQLVLAELYNEHIHGISDTYDINAHYLVIEKFNNNTSVEVNDYGSDYSDDEILPISEIIAIANMYNYKYRKLHIYNRNLNTGQPILNHLIIRNYANIIVTKKYIKPEIAECIYLKNNECVAILKTFWIRLIQRIWKKKFYERSQIILKRRSLHSLKYRQLNGNWPNNCNYLPSIYGMLVF